MEKVVIVKLGVEGGGATIYGRRVDGVWSFWQESTTIFLDENDDEAWRSWSSDPLTDLSKVLPKKWTMMHPMKVHPEFVEQLRREYDDCRRDERGGRRGMTYQHAEWQKILGRSEAS